VEFLLYLAELDRRKLYLELGFSSTFAFLTDHLGLTRSSAFRRTTAARLVARFPVVAEYLDDGRLCLTTLVELRDVLEASRLAETPDRAAGRSEEQAGELVAALRPRPAPMDLLRRLREPRPAAPPEPVSAGPALTPPPVRPAPRVEPISEELRVLRMTVGRAFVADLEAVPSAVSHPIPDGNLEQAPHAWLRPMRRHCQRRPRGPGGRGGRTLRPGVGARRSVAPRRRALHVPGRGRAPLRLDPSAGAPPHPSVRQGWSADGGQPNSPLLAA